MKNIFVYVGSRTGRKSTTFNFVKEVLNRVLSSVGKDSVTIDIYTASSTQIKNCNGCINCFTSGDCPQDNSDDMKIIKSKMENADFIIFASPVYLHNVSGDMKIFFDRISYWTHLLKLSGKAGIAIATSTGNGLELTTSYMHKVMSYLGIKVVNTFGVVPYDMNPNLENAIETCSDIISEYVKGKEIKSDNILELVFKANKFAIEAQKDLDSEEYKYWQQSGLINCNDFEEVLDVIKKNKELTLEMC